MPDIVLDSSAVLRFLFDEPGAERVERILADAVAEGKRVLISAVNWAEVLHVVNRMRGVIGLTAARQMEQTTPMEVVPLDRKLAERAAELKSRYKLGLADACAVALAKECKAVLVTGDRDFERAKREVKIVWLKK